MVKRPTGFLSLMCCVKKDGSALRVLSFSYKLFAGKHVPDISLYNISVIDEYGFAKIISLQSEVISWCIIGCLY